MHIFSTAEKKTESGSTFGSSKIQ